MAEKKINADIRVQGTTFTDSVEKNAGGSANEVFTTDGGATVLPTQNVATYNGFQYF